MISIEIDDAEIRAALEAAIGALSDMSPLMNKIGAAVRDQTEDRFQVATSPDGDPWAPRSPSTLKSYERRARKPGGVASWGGILHYSGQMSGNIFHEFGPDFAAVGSPEPYAAMMQFGGSKERFPHLWGDIPARPYLGLSDDDRLNVLEIIAEHLGAALEP